MDNIEIEYERLYANDTKEQKIVEINRLYRLYNERSEELKKASRIRWILTFAGFAILVCCILVAISDGIESLFSADFKSIVMLLISGILVTGFHFFVNVSVFGWLFQKDIAAGRQLDNLETKINVLEKLIEK